MKTHLRALLFAATLTAATLITQPCRAQLAVGVTFSVSHLTVDSEDTFFQGQEAEGWIYGPTMSLQGEWGPSVVKFGFDMRFGLLTGSGYGVQSGDLGFRIAVPLPIIHIKPYAEYCLGAMQARNALASTNYTGHIDDQLIIGVDIPLRYHLDLRALEYSYGGIDGVGGSGEDIRHQLSSGLLVRF